MRGGEQEVGEGGERMKGGGWRGQRKNERRVGRGGWGGEWPTETPL